MTTIELSITGRHYIKLAAGEGGTCAIPCTKTGTPLEGAALLDYLHAVENIKGKPR